MFTTGLLLGSTAVLLVWGLLDIRDKHKRDGVFLLLLGVFDGTAAVHSYFEYARLEAKLAPRNLTSNEKALFVAKLGPGPKVPIVVLTNGDARRGDKVEQEAFASDLRDAFQAAGWTVTISSQSYPRRPQLLQGLAVWGDLGPSLTTVGDAFESVDLLPVVGTFAAANATASPVASAIKGPHIEIDVYSKPLRD